MEPFSFAMTSAFCRIRQQALDLMPSKKGSVPLLSLGFTRHIPDCSRR